MTEDIYHRPIDKHGGNKYVRVVRDVGGLQEVRADVYAVLRAFGVTCPGLQQAAKKILCAGVRGKGSRVQDVREAIDALFRALQFAEQDEADEKGAVEELKKAAGTVTHLPGGGLVIGHKVESLKAKVKVPEELLGVPAANQPDPNVWEGES